MRQTLGPVLAAGLFLVSSPAARAQVAPAAVRPLTDATGHVAPLPVSIYAAETLPASLSHPWLIVPRYSTAAPALRFGDPFSPYGVYSRYAYYRTGPFPGVIRPYVRFDKGWHD